MDRPTRLRLALFLREYLPHPEPRRRSVTATTLEENLAEEYGEATPNMIAATKRHLPSFHETGDRTGPMRLSTQLRFFPGLFVFCLFPVSALASDTVGNNLSWQQRCAGIRTSYNPHTDLRADTLTIEPRDQRWPLFLSWIQARQIATSTLIGLSIGTPTTAKGIVFRWASRTPWERDVVMPFGQALAHLIAERNWYDLDFLQFFSSRGGVYGVTFAERLSMLDPHSLAPWQEFFATITAPTSVSTPLLQARLSAIAPDGQSVTLSLGPGRVVTYSAARLLLDLQSVLTDCTVYEFFQTYDQQHSHQPPTSGSLKQPARVILLAVAPRGQTPELPMHGRTVYDHHCSGCHGVNGDGKGLLATSLRPQPRDFTKALFRYRSTPTGQLPTDEDLLRTVTQGLPSSTMPAWEPFLSAAERQAVVAYLQNFSPRFTVEAPRKAAPLPEPPAVSTERIARGEKLYHESGCGSCHGETGKGDGRAGKDLKTAEGDPVVPRDLTNKWGFHGGHSAQDVFQRLSTGMDGSPMASYSDVFSPSDLWDLVFYVLSLSPAERPQGQTLREPNPS